MRLSDLTPEEMTPEQRSVAEEAASGKRGHVPAPLRAWIHSPEFGRRAQRLGEFLRYDTTLPPALSGGRQSAQSRRWRGCATQKWRFSRGELNRRLAAPIILSVFIGVHQWPIWGFDLSCWEKKAYFGPQMNTDKHG